MHLAASRPNTHVNVFKYIPSAPTRPPPPPGGGEREDSLSWTSEMATAAADTCFSLCLPLLCSLFENMVSHTSTLLCINIYLHPYIYLLTFIHICVCVCTRTLCASRVCMCAGLYAYMSLYVWQLINIVLRLFSHHYKDLQTTHCRGQRHHINYIYTESLFRNDVKNG